MKTVVILVIAIALLFAVVVMLNLLERKVKSRIKKDEPSISSKYLRRLGTIKKSKAKMNAKLSKLNQLSRRFMEEKYNLGDDKEYEELEDIFSKKNNIEISKFASKMKEIYYEKEEISKSDLSEAIELFTKILKED